jgi:hypothetical protein
MSCTLVPKPTVQGTPAHDTVNEELLIDDDDDINAFDMGEATLCPPAAHDSLREGVCDRPRDCDMLFMSMHVWYNTVFNVPQLGFSITNTQGDPILVTDDMFQRIKLSRVIAGSNHVKLVSRVANTHIQHEGDTLHDSGVSNRASFPSHMIEPHPLSGQLLTVVHPCETAKSLTLAKNEVYMMSWLHMIEQLFHY